MPDDQLGPDGRPIGMEPGDIGSPIAQAVVSGGGPIDPAGVPGSGGAFISAPGAFVTPGIAVEAGITPGTVPPISPLFNIGGAPIAILGGVFSGGLPLAGPLTQIFRGGGGPLPPTLFIATISPSGPIGAFFIGTEGGPIGAETFGGGGLPIGAPAEAEQVEAILQPRTVLVGAGAPIIGPEVQPVLIFESARAAEPGQPIGG